MRGCQHLSLGLLQCPPHNRLPTLVPAPQCLVSTWPHSAPVRMYGRHGSAQRPVIWFVPRAPRLSSVFCIWTLIHFSAAPSASLLRLNCQACSYLGAFAPTLVASRMFFCREPRSTGSFASSGLCSNVTSSERPPLPLPMTFYLCTPLHLSLPSTHHPSSLPLECQLQRGRGTDDCSHRHLCSAHNHALRAPDTQQL